MQYSDFSQRLVTWQRQNGRHNLPWQVQNPYHVWLSEIMLQQTQVTTVLNYYPRFLLRFPSVKSLASASTEDILALWSGLGYYSRARNLHKAAQQIMQDFDGRFPDTREALQTLTGIGRSTAAAIAAFAFNQREAILDGNVKRVLTRFFGIEGIPSARAVEQHLWSLAEQLLPQNKKDMPAYTQGLMDLGSLICTRSRPRCSQCPVKSDCTALRENRTAELPTRKPRKAVPSKHLLLLLARHNDHFYFERRPLTGIWGGLLSLPECSDTLAAQHLLEYLGKGELTVSLPEFEHQLTHFRLIITPQPAEIYSQNNWLQPPKNGQWLTIDEALEAGVPVPIKKILQQCRTPGVFT